MKKFKVIFKEAHKIPEIEADGYFYDEKFVNFFLECDKKECCENGIKHIIREMTCAVNIDSILSIHESK